MAGRHSLPEMMKMFSIFCGGGYRLYVFAKIHRNYSLKMLSFDKHIQHKDYIIKQWRYTFLGDVRYFYEYFSSTDIFVLSLPRGNYKTDTR